MGQLRPGGGTSQQDIVETDVTGHPISEYTHFKFGWVVKIKGDGLSLSQPPTGGTDGKS
jgi:hypothetical protein